MTDYQTNSHFATFPSDRNYLTKSGFAVVLARTDHQRARRTTVASWQGTGFASRSVGSGTRHTDCNEDSKDPFIESILSKGPLHEASIGYKKVTTDAEKLDQILAIVREIRAGQGKQADPWMSVDQASSYLSVARATIYKWVHEGRVPHHKIPGSGLVRFRASELDQWIEIGRDGANEAVKDVLRKLR
jgi:excisionase family DNA binding protein